MKKTPASLRSDGPLAAISEIGGRNRAKSLAELSEIRIYRKTKAERQIAPYDEDLRKAG